VQAHLELGLELIMQLALETIAIYQVLEQLYGVIILNQIQPPVQNRVLNHVVVDLVIVVPIPELELEQKLEQNQELAIGTLDLDLLLLVL